jgi:hypothetical protein
MHGVARGYARTYVARPRLLSRRSRRALGRAWRGASAALASEPAGKNAVRAAALAGGRRAVLSYVREARLRARTSAAVRRRRLRCRSHGAVPPNTRRARRLCSALMPGPARRTSALGKVPHVRCREPRGRETARRGTLHVAEFEARVGESTDRRSAAAFDVPKLEDPPAGTR